MLQRLQILQIGLFAIPVLVLITIGVLILIKPVLIFHRRYYLLAFVPLLLANPLALIEDLTFSGGTPFLDWRLGFVLAVDLGLIIAGYWLLRGWQVYGLSRAEATLALKDWFDEHGWEMNFETTEKTTWWGNNRRGRRLRATRDDEALSFWLIRQGNEIQLHGETLKAEKCLRQVLPSLGHVEKAYQYQEHLTGVLYIILGIVLAVMMWIFFFEPRLILIE